MSEHTLDAWRKVARLARDYLSTLDAYIAAEAAGDHDSSARAQVELAFLSGELRDALAGVGMPVGGDDV